MDVLPYKSLEIEAVPEQLADTGQWTTSLFIRRIDSDGTGWRQFSANNCFSTREEAVANCFNLGKLIIDGKMPNCTVEGL